MNTFFHFIPPQAYLNTLLVRVDVVIVVPWLRLSNLQRLKSATLYWPGSDVTIQGGYAPYWKSYLTHLTFEERINQVGPCFLLG